MSRLFSDLERCSFFRDLGKDAFASNLATFLATLNAIHPFREGNGRTQLVFAGLLAHEAGHPLNLDRLREQDFLEAMIASFGGDEAPLRTEILRMIG